MENPKFKRAATARRFIAILATIAFHLALIGGLTYGTENEIAFDKYIPDTLKEWMGKDLETDKRLTAEDRVQP